MKIREKYRTSAEGISAAVFRVRDFLDNYGLKGKDLEKAVLLAEETLTSMASYAVDNSEATLSIRTFLGSVTMELSCAGGEFEYVSAMPEPKNSLDEFSDGLDEDAMRRLSSIILQSYAEELKYKHRKGVNHVKIVVVRSKHAFLYQTLGAMMLAIILGWILSAVCPEAFNNAFDSYLLVPIKTMYMNALKMVVAPVVFFSIVSCIVKFSDLSELGRVGFRIIAMYFFTTCFAVGIGIGVFYLCRPGNVLINGGASDVSAITSQEINVSIKDMIVGIIPSNFVQPFLESNMLQLIFLAVICGIAASMIKKYSDLLKDLFEAFNDLFLKITMIIIRFMPIAAFCSICSMMLSMGGGSLLSVLGMFGTFILGLTFMMCFYCFLMLAVGRLNPVPFLKKYAPTMLQTFSMNSSNASIPINMEACSKLGIPKKIYSLSIPLGATLNMDGTCVHLAVFALALAKIYGVQITGASITAMIISIIVLSMGAPGIPGAGLICLSVLLNQLNVPVEAIGLVMGIDALVGMFRTMSNCLGDVAVSTIVAKKEAALDMDQYNK